MFIDILNWFYVILKSNIYYVLNPLDRFLILMLNRKLILNRKVEFLFET